MGFRTAWGEAGPEAQLGEHGSWPGEGICGWAGRGESKATPRNDFWSYI